jgi:predicted anti-sigma-YlaC factor YlaD
MSCREFEGALLALLEGTLSRADHARAVRHAASCAACFALVAPMGAELAPVAAEPPASLLPSVLLSTSNAPSRSRWADTWRRWALRPRFASEVAYVGVVMLSVLATLDDTPVEARSARARIVIHELCSEAGILVDRAASLLQRADLQKETP